MENTAKVPNKGHVLKIAVVQFDLPPRDSASATQTYEYVMPEGATGDETHAVVCTSNNGFSPKNLRFVSIVKIKSVEEQEYEGELKPIVVAFNGEKYSDYISRVRKRRNLLAQMTKAVEEQAKIEMFRKMAENNPALQALLSEYENL